MPIQKLSPLLVNQIAAGEVIERPASVVKELVENSLDAGASLVDVIIEDGGRQLIRVADNGCGIETDQLHLAIEPHATSKINAPQDLEQIATLGFRGEALASMASVSQAKITSRVANSEAGATLEVAGDQIGQVQPVGCGPGTVIEVRNLFFNTPARRKFMRGAPTEFGHISNLLQRLAMAHPDVAFKLTNNGRVTFDLPPNQPPVQRCLTLLGKDLTEALLEFNSNEAGVKLWGLAGLPSIAKATTKFQYVYVNGRPVRDRNIAHAMKEAYRGLMEPNRQPVMVLFVGIDPTMVDVNVHPAKSEVRFVDSNRIHGQVLAVIRQRLLASDLTPTVILGPDTGQFPAVSPGISLDSLAGQNGLNLTGSQGGFDFSSPAPPSPFGSHSSHATGQDSSDSSMGQAHTANESVQTFVNYFKQMDPHQKGFVYQQVKRELQESGELPQETQSLTQPVQTTTRTILQIHDSYIVTQDESGIVIVDQHALHERVMFATLIDRIRQHGQLESQRLLTPATFEASPDRIAKLPDLKPLFDKLGIEAEPMGPNAIAIHAFASLLFDRKVEPIPFVPELIDKAITDGIDPDDEVALHKVLDMMSCKAAIKAGDPMSESELNNLLNKYDEVDRASSCPHGRPTRIRLTLSDLEKHFKRT